MGFKFGAWNTLKRLFSRANTWTGQQTFSNINVTGGSIAGAVITEKFAGPLSIGSTSANWLGVATNLDTYNGVVLTNNVGTGGLPNTQTFTNPTAATVKIFTVVVDDGANVSQAVVANGVTFTITPGESQPFIYDGSAWGPTDLGITAIPVVVAQGGTGASTLTDHGILLGSGTSAITPMAVLATGEIVIGATGADAKALAAQTAASRKFLHQTGTGTAGQDPTWETIISGDLTTALTTPPAIGGSTPAAGAFTTVNALTLTAQATGFTVAGGTTSKTLTVALDANVAGTNTGDVTLATDHGLGLTNQVLNMGTPSSVTGASTNSVTTTTHTHALDLTAPPAIGGTTPAAITGSAITVKSADPQYDLKDSSCADSDVNAQIAAEATTTTSGAENIDLIMRAQLAGVLTELLRYDASDDQWEPAKPFVFGSLDLGTDTGAVTLADKIVTSSAATTDESYMFKIDGNPALTVYAESDGAGGIQKARLVFAYPIAPSNESIQSASEGVAASLTKDVTYITTNGDEDLDNITLADGVFVGQRKEFAVKAVGHANDSVKITPATMVGGTQITFAASPLGLGCHMSWSSAGWVVTANNGGTIA